MFARNYANGVIKKSKKIQKASQLSTPNKIQKKKNSNIIIPKLENLDQFCHEETHQFQKTKERTYKMIQFDKELLKKALISLQNYSKKNMNVEKKCKYDIFLELKFNKTPSKIPLKCFKILLPNFKFPSDWQCCFIVKDSSSFKEKVKNSIDFDRLKVLEYPKNFLNESKELNKKFLSEIDQLFCDSQVYNLLMKKEGRFLHQNKKVPYPINCESIPNHSNQKDYSGYIQSLFEASYLILMDHKTQIFKIANIDMSLKDGLNNIINGAFYGISCILKSSEKFTTVTEICLKTINSMPLPIWVSRKDESEIN